MRCGPDDLPVVTRRAVIAAVDAAARGRLRWRARNRCPARATSRRDHGRSREQVDVCTLLRPNDVDAASSTRRFETVRVEYGAAQVPTLPLRVRYRVRGAAADRRSSPPGPFRANVFEDAYGDAAGGDPEFLSSDSATAAFLRNEPDDHGRSASLSTEPSSRSTVSHDPANPWTKQDDRRRWPDRRRSAPGQPAARADAPDFRRARAHRSTPISRGRSVPRRP